MIRYALFALPGPGDELLLAARKAGKSPALLVYSKESDFHFSDVPKICGDDASLLSEMHARRIDLILVAGWEKKIPAAYYESLPHGGWNIHPSLLPAYRGHNPYFHVLANGEAETGVTVHRLTEHYDEGAILLSKKIRIDAFETIGSLWHKLARLGAAAALEALELFESGRFTAQPQPAGTYPRAPRVNDRDFQLTPSLTVRGALNLIRACNPFYGATCVMNDRAIKIFEARPVEAGSSGPIWKCSDGSIEITVLGGDDFGIISGNRYLARIANLSGTLLTGD